MIEETISQVSGILIRKFVYSVEMGICISVASSEIHEAEDCQENVLNSAENIASNRIQRLGSLYSKQGSKGLNQDAAILRQV